MNVHTKTEGDVGVWVCVTQMCCAALNLWKWQNKTKKHVALIKTSFQPENVTYLPLTQLYIVIFFIFRDHIDMMGGAFMSFHKNK